MILCHSCLHLLSHAFTADGPSNAVDVYNSATGTWSTARLSVARDRIAATSVGNVALFAGGYIQGRFVITAGGFRVAAFAAVL